MVLGGRGPVRVLGPPTHQHLQVARLADCAGELQERSEQRLTFAVLDLQRRRRFRLDPSPDEDDPPYMWVLIEGPRFLPREEWEEMGGCYLALDGSNVDRELLIRRGAPQPGIADLTLYMRRTSSRLGGAR